MIQKLLNKELRLKRIEDKRFQKEFKALIKRYSLKNPIDKVMINSKVGGSLKKILKCHIQEKKQSSLEALNCKWSIYYSYRLRYR